MKHTAVAALALVALAACRGEPTPEPVAAGPAPGLQRWILPTAPGAAQPDLVLAPDGRLLLSWLDSQPGRRTRLQFSDHGDAGSWGATRTIAIGSSFFVNWADTPHLMATPDGMLWVQWLQKSGEGAYAYDVVLSNSRNDGMNWSAPIRPHEDGTVSEHGFAALWAQGNDRLGIAWLDGRNTVAKDDDAAHDADEAAGVADEHAEHGRGAMTLRAAFFDGAQRKTADTELDDSACDCCQTDVAMTGRGTLLVYRDRTADEIRDIHAMRHDGRAWSESKPVFADGWRMPACPVNGPAVAAQGDAAVVGWYTAAGDLPTVRLARSDDAGGSFAPPVDVDSGAQVQGRVDVAVAADAAWVLWLREDADGQSLMLARYAPDLSRRIEQLEVAKLQGRGRGTGFPQLVLRNGVGYIVWTDIVEGRPRLQGATYRPDAGPTSPSAS